MQNRFPNQFLSSPSKLGNDRLIRKHLCKQGEEGREGGANAVNKQRVGTGKAFFS